MILSDTEQAVREQGMELIEAAALNLGNKQ